MRSQFVALFAGAFLVTACHDTTPTVEPQSDLDPCSAAGRTAIEAKTVISKPAPGNIDEVDPKLPKEKQLEELGDVNVVGDQCRAVLGPLPTVSCPDSPLVPLSHDGKKLTYENATFYEDGKPTTWRPEQGCDHPGHISLLFASTKPAHPEEGCLPNPRLGSVTTGSVTWAWTCHFFRGHQEKTDKFDFLTLIGTNRLTGETCFFVRTSGDEEKHRFYGKDVMPPGGIHPNSEAERREAGIFWDPNDGFGCMDCHGAGSAWLVTPHTNQRRVRGDGTMELLPAPATRSLRVIGTAQNMDLRKPPKAIWPKNDDGTPDKSCTKCHVLTDQENFLRLARFAVGLPDLPQHHEKTKTWLRDPKPWMPPDNDGSPEDVKAAQDAVLRYERAVNDPKWRYREAEVLSPCPKPKGLAQTDVSLDTRPDGKRVAWKYKNDLGEVPLRDDVRFEVEIKGSDGASCKIRNVAPSSLGSEQWQVTLPAKSGTRYEYVIRPYRYCFDEKGYEFGDAVTVK